MKKTFHFQFYIWIQKKIIVQILNFGKTIKTWELILSKMELKC